MSRWSLAARLVAGIAALLAVLALAIGAVTVAASRDQAVGRLDRLLIAASESSQKAVDAGLSGPRSIVEILPGQGAGAIGMVIVDDTVFAGYLGTDGSARRLSTTQVQSLVDLPRDGEPRSVDLGDLGDYRVVSTALSDGRVVANGLSLSEADAAAASLVQTIAAVSLVAIALAVLLGVAVVRLALRPLTRVVETAARVTELPLDSGDPAMPDRVPVDAPDTEVGRVGVALNRLLERVESALAARHASEQKVRRFVADASHELRTPLASIRGYTELARRPARLPRDTARSLERIESEATRMSTLVEEMMLLARLDAGRELHRAEVALGGLLVEALSDAHAAGPDHAWEITLPEEDVEVRGDRDRLAQAVANLLANARLHTPAGTRVEVSLAREGAEAVIAVADDGPGIPESLLPGLFERFTRGDDARSRAAGSTGLGLAIVRAIARAHDGEVSVASAPGATRFELRLPIATLDA